MDALPFGDIDTLFLDVGNTLLSIDFELIGARLSRHGFEVGAEALARAEAAARPLVSRRVARGASTEGFDAFHFYIETVLQGLEDLPRPDIEALAASLAREIKRDVPTPVLWSRRLDGVEASLTRFLSAGLTLVAVSNSDGTAEDSLVRAGLREPFHAVVDSHIVGVEKPAPGIFQHALRLVDAQAARTLHVGDLYDIDVVGARAAGLHGLLLDPHGDWAHVDCPRIPDLPSLANRLDPTGNSQA